MNERINNMNKPVLEYEVPKDLFGTVIAQIKNEARKRARRNFFVSVGATIISVFILVPAVVWLYQDMIQSGFSQIFSLIFSDGAVIAGSWQAFISSLIETVPFLSVVVCLGAVLAFLESLRFTFKSKEMLSGHLAI